MKRISILLLISALLALWGCAAEPAPAETSAPMETSVPTETSAPPAATTLPAATNAETAAETETTQATPEGDLFLSVSAITFSLVGEEEEIYVGTAPAEAVTFRSEDESVATFRGGVLTATGVGTTTVTARFGDQALQCKVSCLAATEEELNALDKATLRSPKRLPPEMPGEPMDFFDDAAIIGDSISYVMMLFELQFDLLGEPTFLVRGGTGIRGLVLNYEPISFRGEPTEIGRAIAESGARKAFILLGQNDVSCMSIEETMEYWEKLIAGILEQNPELEIHLQSCIPQYFEGGDQYRKNDLLAAHNEQLKAFAETHGCRYVDIARYVMDHEGQLVAAYSQPDGIHMNEAGCRIWMQLLKAYAQWLSLQ